MGLPGKLSYEGRCGLRLSTVFVLCSCLVVGCLCGLLHDLKPKRGLSAALIAAPLAAPFSHAASLSLCLSCVGSSKWGNAQPQLVRTHL